MKFKELARALKGAAEFPLRDYHYTRTADGAIVDVTIDSSSYRQKFTLNPDSGASAAEKALLTAFGCEVWDIREMHTPRAGGAALPSRKKKIKFNATLYATSAADVRTFLQYFVKGTHSMFGADAYGPGISTYTTNQGQNFRYHADRNHGLPDQADLALTDAEKESYLAGILPEAKRGLVYHSLGLSVNEVADADGKYGNIELKFRQGGHKVILNLHLKHGAALSTQPEALAKISKFRNIASSIRCQVESFFKDKEFSVAIQGIPGAVPAPAGTLPASGHSAPTNPLTFKKHLEKKREEDKSYNPFNELGT